MIQTSQVFHPPFFSKKISAGDEIQLLIGDLFKFPSIFFVLCFVHKKKSRQTSQQPLKLCGPVPLAMSPMVGPKKSEGLFRLGNFQVNFRLEFGCRKPPNETFFNLPNKTTKRNSFDLRKKGAVFWKMRKPRKKMSQNGPTNPPKRFD